MSSNCVKQAVAEHLGGDAGAVGNEEDGAALAHGMRAELPTAHRRERQHPDHGDGLSPVLPDGIDACRKRRQVAEIQPAFAEAMEIAAARRLEAVATRERREFGELRRRV